jgi:DNA-binding GntR family transcriptional regulator
MASRPGSSSETTAERTAGAGPAPRVAPVRNRRALADSVSGLIAREFIFSQVVAAGDLLPSEKELAERYGVSRVTTRASLRTLREAGLITVRQGVGSIVLPRSDVLRLSLDRLSSVETFAREAGREVETDAFEIEVQEADDDTAKVLQIAEGEPVFVVPRAKIYQGTRVAWLIDYVRQDLLSLETIRAEMEGSVLDVLLAHDELAVDHAECEISPVAFSEDIAARLDVEPGTVGLFMDEVVYTVDGRALGRCLGWHLHLPTYRRFFVRRRRPVSDY